MHDFRAVIAAQAARSNTRITRPTSRQRAALLAEEDAFRQAKLAGDLPHPDMRPIRSMRAGVASGIDWQVRMDTMHVERPNHVPEDVGCTVAALDYRDSAAKRRVKGTAANPVATATGGKRLAVAGPGPATAAKRV